MRRSSRLLDQTGDGHRLRRLLSEADDVADLLEETAFMLTVVPVNIDKKSIAMLEELAELVNRSAREYVRCSKTPAICRTRWAVQRSRSS